MFKEHFIMTYLSINGTRLSIEEIAEKFGIQGKPVCPTLCQEVPAGIVRAVADNSEPFCGIDLELDLANVAGTVPILLARAEQPNPDGEVETPTVYLYGRGDEYVAFMQVDTRPDERVEEEPEDTRITISGNPGEEVKVFAENPYVRFNCCPDPRVGDKIPF